MSACNMEDQLSAVYYWACAVWVEQLLCPFIAKCFLTNVPVSWAFDPMSLIWPLGCNFYLYKRKQRLQGCSINSGILLHSVEWLNEWMKDYLCLQSHWETLSFGNQCGLSRFIKPSKTNVSKYGSRTVISTSKVYVCCVRSVAFW